LERLSVEIWFCSSSTFLFTTIRKR
jgi:hypothetical protein